MASNITIREMTPDDREEIIAFIEDEEFLPHRPENLEGSCGVEHYLYRSGPNFKHLAALNKQRQAIAVLVGCENDLWGLHVQRQYRRVRIARQLFASYCDDLRSAGYRSVTTDVARRYKALCEAAGFTGFDSSGLGSPLGAPADYKMLKALPTSYHVDDRSEPVDLVLRAFSMDDDRPDHRPHDCVEYQIRGFRQGDGSIQFNETIVLPHVSDRLRLSSDFGRPAFELQIDGDCFFLGCINNFTTKLVPSGFRKDPGGQYYLERLCPNLTHASA
ncbi:MAG: hypothetical protein AAFX02_10095 [Pseudomonadota bacterium]